MTKNNMTLLARISPHNDARSAYLAGVGLMLLGVFMFAFGDALGKYIVATYSVGQLLCLRACAALFVLSPVIWRNRAQFIAVERPRLQLIRVVLSTLEVAAFFLATVYLPLADNKILEPALLGDHAMGFGIEVGHRATPCDY